MLLINFFSFNVNCMGMLKLTCKGLETVGFKYLLLMMAAVMLYSIGISHRCKIGRIFDRIVRLDFYRFLRENRGDSGHNWMTNK